METSTAPQFSEGDEVVLTFGRFTGHTGFVTSVAPSGRFFTVAVVGECVVHVHESDVEAVD